MNPTMLDVRKAYAPIQDEVTSYEELLAHPAVAPVLEAYADRVLKFAMEKSGLPAALRQAIMVGIVRAGTGGVLYPEDFVDPIKEALETGLTNLAVLLNDYDECSAMWRSNSNCEREEARRGYRELPPDALA